MKAGNIRKDKRDTPTVFQPECHTKTQSSRARLDISLALAGLDPSLCIVGCSIFRSFEGPSNSMFCELPNAHSDGGTFLPHVAATTTNTVSQKTVTSA
jgi:hypothetical protein